MTERFASFMMTGLGHKLPRRPRDAISGLPPKSGPQWHPRQPRIHALRRRCACMLALGGDHRVS